MNIVDPKEIWYNLKLEAAEVRRRDRLRAISVPQKVIEAIVKAADKPLVTETELIAIKQLDAEWLRLRKLLMDHTDEAARKDYQKSKRELAKAISKGGKLPQDNWNSNDFQEDYLMVRSRTKQATRETTTEALAYYVKIATRFACTAEDLAARVEASEKIEFEKFGVAYVPSELVWNIRAAGFQIFLRLPVPGMGGHRPAWILENIVKIETVPAKP